MSDLIELALGAAARGDNEVALNFVVQVLRDHEQRLPAREQVAEAGELSDAALRVHAGNAYEADNRAGPNASDAQNYGLGYLTGYRAGLRTPPASVKAEVVELLDDIRGWMVAPVGTTTAGDADKLYERILAALSRATEGGK